MRALSQAKNSELVLYCVDVNNFDENHLVEAKRLICSAKISEESVLFVFTKLDLNRNEKVWKNDSHIVKNKVAISAKTGVGITNLRKVILKPY